MNTPPTVLFICQHNAGRSQLGAHMLAVVAPDQFIAKSAGVSPADVINPVVAAALLVEWEFANPEEWNLTGVRTMRDAITTQIRRLAAEMLSPSQTFTRGNQVEEFLSWHNVRG